MRRSWRKRFPAESTFGCSIADRNWSGCEREGSWLWNDLDSLVSGQFLRTIPGVHPCDGFFVAILQKS